MALPTSWKWQEQNMYYVDKTMYLPFAGKKQPGTCSLSVPAASARVSF